VAVTNRNAISVTMFVASDDNRFPVMNRSIRPRITVRRLTLAAAIVIAGEPIITPTAYPVIA
jgi:hypothetical protein